MARTREAVYEERVERSTLSPFWVFAAKVSAEVDTWPDWKKNTLGSLAVLEAKVQEVRCGSHS